jgi:putative nucleotidyltransferase with HDIG domain
MRGEADLKWRASSVDTGSAGSSSNLRQALLTTSYAGRVADIGDLATAGPVRSPVMARSDAAVIIGGLAALSLVRIVDQPLFTIVAEFAFLVGVIAVLESARVLRAFVADDFPLVLAVSLGWVATLRIMHVAADPMTAFVPGASAILQEEIELAAGVILGAGMLFSPLAIGRRLPLAPVVAVQALVTISLAAAILSGRVLLPVGSNEDPTLLASAISAAVSIALAGAMLMTYRRRLLLARPFFVGVEAALGMATAAVLLEAVFHEDTLTHLLWVAFVALVYVAITRNGLVRPTAMMIEGLRANERAAVRQRDDSLERLRASESRYRTMFEDSPVAMWEEDHSLAMSHIRDIAAADDITDLVTYLCARPQEYMRCIALVKVRDVNREAVRLFGAQSRQELLARVDEMYPPEKRSNLCRFWATLLSGGRTAQFEETAVTLTGRKLDLLETCSVAPSHEQSCDRVYVADLDVTARVEADRQLRSALASTVTAFESATELRDPYTAGHQRRVAEFAVAIARELGLDDVSLSTTRIAAQLHDIGKTIVPADILSLPRELTPIEMDLVRQHAQAGADIVATIDFGRPDIATIIAQHHERVDGSGYPAGLEGESILLEARIVGVADVAEAMVSHRPYRPARTLEETLAELEAGAGRRYDAAVCAAAAGLLADGRFVFSDARR